ncbi:MAG: acyloxyacyl hydrolase [Bacteroidetes bacterium]|nr:acyloxyacyl hydrolase [Bacteroidota bacterium]
MISYFKIMKTKLLLLSAILLIPFLNVKPQGIGELAPAKPSEKFPNNAWGIDIMFSEGGFGLGTFYRRQLSELITGFVDFSISEAQDPREFTFVDYWGNTYTAGKINRAFLLPVNFGMQYRLFENVIYDNLRPYINFGVGPTVVVTDPADQEYFSALKNAHSQVTLGGYIGFGANFGLDKSNLVGINLRYYMIHLFNQGIEILQGRNEKDLGGFYITLNLGTMY